MTVPESLLVCIACNDRFSGHGGAFQAFLVWGWGMFFGIVLVLMSLYTPPWIPTWFPFLQTFLGKGLYISLGASLTSGWCSDFCFQMFVFVYCIILAVSYIVMHCVCGLNAMPGPLCVSGSLQAFAHGVPPPPPTAKEKEGTLPAGWRSAVDPASGQVYYSHSSGVTQWIRP